MEIRPVAKIYTAFKDKFGIPRQSGRGKSLLGKIVFEPDFRFNEAVREIEGFSHLWLIFDFSMSHRDKFSPTVRPPRLGGNKRVGVFASRSPFRPNSLGLSSVRLLSVEHTKEGPVLTVDGVDILDGTPIYDVKPYLSSDLHPDARFGYAEICHSLKVSVDGDVDPSLDKDDLLSIISCIEEDPRPSYQDNPERVYKMQYKDYTVCFTVKSDKATITKITK